MDLSSVYDPQAEYQKALKLDLKTVLVQFDAKSANLSSKMPHFDSKRVKIQLASLVVENGLIARIQQGLCIIKKYIDVCVYLCMYVHPYMES